MRPLLARQRHLLVRMMMRMAIIMIMGITTRTTMRTSAVARRPMLQISHSQ
jgi:hypothetical protein